MIGRYLARSQRRADAFVGVIGNNYTPLEGLMALTESSGG